MGDELENLEELAALNAVGALDGKDSDHLQGLALGADPVVASEVARFNNVAALLLASLSDLRPPAPEMKERILRQVEQGNTSQRSHNLREIALAQGFSLIRGEEASGWRKLSVPGAFVKLLSLDQTRGYAVVLGKLDAGARYPAHQHSGPEEVYVLSGDLNMGGLLLRAGDFHHADAGTRHGENFSENGCTILAVISNLDVLTQFKEA